MQSFKPASVLSEPHAQSDTSVGSQEQAISLHWDWHFLCEKWNGYLDDSHVPFQVNVIPFL